MAIAVSVADRKLLLGTVLLLLVLSVLIGSAGVPSSPNAPALFPSSYSSSPDGAAAAYALLQDIHFSVQRWEEPPARLADADPGGVLILAEPTETPTPGEQVFLKQFVEKGGRILFCGGAFHSFFGAASLAKGTGSEVLELGPAFPSPFTRGGRRFTVEPRWFWKKRSPDQIALFGGEREPVVVVWHLGLGEVLWWASATALTNSAIGQGDNVSVFLDAVSSPPESPGRPIYWDEYFHGSRGSLWGYVARTPLKWVLAQCGVLLAAILFAFSRRSGPIVTPRKVSRLSPIEFVDTLGGLYARAGATSVATGIAYRHLRFVLSRRLLLSAGTPDVNLSRAAAQRLGFPSEKLADVLQSGDASQNRNLRPKDALALVQRIGYYLERLANQRSSTETE